MTQFPRLSLCSSPSFSLLRFSCSYSLVSSPVPYHPPPSNYISTTGHSFSINHYFFFTYTSFETTLLKVGLWIQASAVNEFTLFLKRCRLKPNCGRFVMRLRSWEKCNLQSEYQRRTEFYPLHRAWRILYWHIREQRMREICILRSKSQVESAWAKSWQVYLICLQVCMCME